MFFNHKESESIGLEYIKNSLSCRTPYGRALIRALKPNNNKHIAELIDELDNITLAIDLLKNQADNVSKLENFFSQIRDIKRSIESIPENVLDSVALFEIKRFLLLLQHIVSSVERLNVQFIRIVIPPCIDALNLINPDKSNAASFHISDVYSKKLSTIRKHKHEIEASILSAKTEQVIEQLKIERLKIVEAEFDEELKIRQYLSEELAEHKEEILLAIHSIGRLDFILQKARLAILHNAVKPVIASDDVLEFDSMRNPYFNSILKAKKRNFVPISIALQPGTTVITGANMGGKSMAIKTLALNVSLAMCGFFVFADKAILPIIEHICLIAQDYESVSSGLSSFGGEILKLKHELKHINAHSLMLFDEFAKGTNPEEGAQIVRALVKFLNTQKAFSVIATHYNGATIHAKKHYRVAGLKAFFDKGFEGNSDNGLEVIASNMDYGLYEAPTNSDCPTEAKYISRFLLQGEEVLEYILNETD
ncbi:MAG: hypothetical protein GX802_01895 [Clostridiales bacterium]|nr:hypothetical protein [Clostridiales bacterium]